MKLKSLPLEERPREKLIKNSPKNLTNSELLAIILGTGNKKENVVNMANKLFNKYNIKSLSQTTASKLIKEQGIGNAKACQVASCFELGRRLAAFREGKKPVIKNAKDIVKIFLNDMISLKQEHFKVAYLNSRNRIIKDQTIFIGSLNESAIYPREIFR